MAIFYVAIVREWEGHSLDEVQDAADFVEDGYEGNASVFASESAVAAAAMVLFDVACGTETPLEEVYAIIRTAQAQHRIDHAAREQSNPN